jgi:DNA modification methylase
MTRISENKIIQNKEKFDVLFPQYIKTIEKLQKKYKLSDGSKFNDLVNFKTNKIIPKHNWYEYKQGYAEELVKNIIESENPNKKYFILDPFCGVGTTNLVSQSLGYKSIGFDINPVAFLASDVKTHYFTSTEVKLIKKGIKNFKPTKSSPLLGVVPKVITSSFDKKSLDSLYKIKYYWENISDGEYVQKFFKLSYLSIIEDCSLKTKDGNGIKLNLKKKKIDDVFNYYINKCNSMLSDIETSNLNIECEFIHGSITIEKYFDKVKNKKVSLSIFSPPYANCFDYCEVYKLEFWMGGFVENYDDFSKYRSIAMRSHVNSKFDHKIINYQKDVDLISETISTFNIWNKNIPDMIRGYFDDTYELLKNIKKLLLKDAKVFIVVANSGYKGILVPTDLLISEIANNIGYKVNKIYHARKIRSSSQQMKDLHLEYDNLMRESIIELQN